MTIALALSIWLATATPEVAQLQVVYPSATFDGTCTLIWAESSDTEWVLSFLTSLRFFRDNQGSPYASTAAVRITLDDGRTFEVPREGIILPMTHRCWTDASARPHSSTLALSASCRAASLDAPRSSRCCLRPIRCSPEASPDSWQARRSGSDVQPVMDTDLAASRSARSGART
jgi:hypothetical protein